MKSKGNYNDKYKSSNKKIFNMKKRRKKVLILSIVTNIQEINCQRRISNVEKSSTTTILVKKKYFR